MAIAYFEQYPDVAASYAQNNYGLTPEAFANFHFENYGRGEQRISPSVAEVAVAGAAGSGTTIKPTLTPVAAAYFNQNPDVATAYQENNYGLTPDQFASTHYQLYGGTEQRAEPTIVQQITSDNLTNLPKYFQDNPDVATAYAQNTYGLTPDQFAAKHFELYGNTEKRTSPVGVTTTNVGTGTTTGTTTGANTGSSLPYFQRNPDVAASYLVNNYGMTPEQFAAAHYAKYGQTEQRAAPTTISNVINTIGSNTATTIAALPKYFTDNPDVAASYLVNNYGLTPEQFAARHFQLYGQREQRVAPPVTAIAGTPIAPPAAPVGQFRELFPSFAESKRLAGQMVANRPSTQSIVSMIQGQTGTPATPIGTTPITTPVNSALPTYFTRNPDVAASYLTNNYGLTPEQFALTHFQKFGQAEQRAAPTGTTATPSLSNVLSMISK